MLRSLVTLAWANIALAATVTYTWEATWVNAAPLGVSRPVIGINGQWPCPKIEANVGDTVVVHLTNKLGNQTTGIHFHGIDQISTNWMDGPSMVTQCPLPPDMTMTYSFTADKGGTYWWHSHNMGQYPDGMRGPLIIHDPNDPYAGQYDGEYILSVSDWYNEQAIPLAQNMFLPTNTRFAPPIPNGMVVNDGLGANFKFEKGKTYRIRMVSFAAFASFMVHFDSHDMNVIMSDAAYVKQKTTYMLRIAPAQRYDILVKCIDRDNRNYGFLIAGDINRDYTNKEFAQSWPFNYTGQLVMFPDRPFGTDVVNEWRPSDDAVFEPYGDVPILPAATKIFQFDWQFCLDTNGIPRACVNGSPYVDQKVPTLYTAATTGENNTNPLVYGAIHPFVVNYGDIVDIVINNRDEAIHPFHLHGHHFQVLRRPATGTGNWPGVQRARLNQKPPRRDTVSVMGKSHAVIRFEATNPGVYLFHCHIEWHVEMGLTATIIEAPERLRNLTVPEDHKAACRAQGIPTAGNAAGNIDNPLDQTGMNLDPSLTYHGLEKLTDSFSATYNPPTAAPAKLRSRVVRNY
ncbi:iron transport multicopper oxidase fetC [Colletotrichum spaethianum]|uniref:Iron transport multicopper oxidase fetC n=1 Tax=Colletotrichum spaethianum TaxID=700344 RepID=A0AA37LET4_9PEZI|nr:iron transport multicopper oxidase fetC [Colletotrichum spaethianum]GKT45119.1 iron transport multicopper oxidase fetC [Colletotrichum spaethianum]